MKLNKVKQEAKILSTFNHPHIMRVYELIESRDGVYIVMEYLPGGELYDLILKKQRFSEDDGRKFFQQLVFALEYCHMHNVVHRDVKPENILLDENQNIKLGDFGLANYFKDGHFLHTSCGSLNYAAPEILTGNPYSGPEVDVWSAGIVLFTLVCGYLPFDESNVSTLFQKIKQADFVLLHTLTPHCKDILHRMLEPDPVQRITFNQLRRHDWFKINMPNHLTYQIGSIIENQTICSMNECKPRSGSTVDEEIFKKTMATFRLVPSETEEEKLKRRLMKKKQDQFCVCYRMLHDEKQKQQMIELNKMSLDICPVFQGTPTRASVEFKVPTEMRRSSSFFDDESEGPYLITPHNWVFGFRTTASIKECVERLFAACIYLELV